MAVEAVASSNAMSLSMACSSLRRAVRVSERAASSSGAGAGVVIRGGGVVSAQLVCVATALEGRREICATALLVAANRPAEFRVHVRAGSVAWRQRSGRFR